MPRFVWLLALCLGCEDDVVPVQQGKNKKGQKEEVVVEAAPEITVVQQIELVRNKALGGEAASAVEGARTLLAQRPEDPVLWMVLEHASLDLDGGASLLTTLSPESPLGGQAKRSEDLRLALLRSGMDLASLKQRATRSTGAEQDVLGARIEILENEDAAFDRRAPRDSAKDALVQLYRAGTLREAAAYIQTASAVEGPDAALLRAESWIRMGERTRAFEELESVLESGNPDQVAHARLELVELTLDGGLVWRDGRESPGAAEAMGWASQVCFESLRDSDRFTMMAGLEWVIVAGLASAQLDLAMAHASQVDLALSAAAGDVIQRARAKTLLARIALRSGHTRTALFAGLDAMIMGTSDAPEAAWWAGLAAFQLEYGITVGAAAGKASGARAKVLEALASASLGGVVEAMSLFDASSLGAEDRALVLPMIAIFEEDSAIERHRAAVAAADETGDLALGIRTRLDLETALRFAYQYSAASRVRTELLGLADTDGMKAEMAARSMLGGATGEGFPGGEQPDLVKLWSSLQRGDVPLAKTDSALSAPVLSWARGRQEMREGDSGYAQYVSSLAALPAHRQGLLSGGTALDGSMGLPSSLELKQISGSTAQQDLGVGLALHEVKHRIEQIRAGLRTGRSLTFSLHHGPKQDLLGAAARSRAQVVYWLAGRAEYPEAAFRALQTAEGHIASHLDNAETEVTGYDRTFHKLLPSAGWEIKDLLVYVRDQSIALISYQQFGDRIHGVALCTHGSFAGDIGSASDLKKAAKEHVESMITHSMESDLQPDHLPGHRLRKQLFDPLKSAFVTEGRDGGGGAKVGKYALVAPVRLINFNFGSLSVNQDGLQVLGRAYSFYSYSSLRSLDHNDRDQPMVSRPVFLGLTVPGERIYESNDAQVGLSDEELIRQSRSKLNLPPDLTKTAARFETSGQVLERDKVTRAVWFEWIRGARYVYLSEFDSGVNGEFKVHDGMISLDEIRSHPIRAELVVISSRGILPFQIARAEAFLEAGAQTVLVLGWEVPDKDVERVIPEFLGKATANKVTGSRMALELKKILASEGDVPGENKYRTAVRGSFLLFSAI